ncbi:zf-CSL-domain-containing protein [Lentinula raphanica]|uniref:Diphthamide biosynthesis protein 3 n=1 Tax=Lentinula raphanica TaxID=153919 RepID=A0AA38P9X1_9AGAR|nr:zf-CSL-domain-containing protein [Lentinula raphanica]KAJ3839032.1 zf-CSL-domain-containing protein [Lentinula raphanica]KAJ3968206.1 zf-CSL-domain-containing protein [Lentinula raphanica]
MGAYYDEVEIEDMVWDDIRKLYHYPCPCGDRFEITRQQLRDYEDIATCPSCSLIIRVIYDPLDFEDEEDAQEKEQEEEDTDSSSSGDENLADILEKVSI